MPNIFTLSELKALASYFIRAEFPESSVQKVINDSNATHNFFSNRAYFYTYTDHHYKFQTGFKEVLTVYRYGDIYLQLAHHDGSEVI